MLELIHTSAPRGLLDDRSGYTTVACTPGMQEDLCAILAQRSAATFARLDEDAAPESRAVYRIWPLKIKGGHAVVMTRIVPVANDFSGRPARLAHHLVFEGEEATGETLAACLIAQGLFVDRWDESPRQLAQRSTSVNSGEGRGLEQHGFRATTQYPQEWARFLATQASTPRLAPCTVLLSEQADLQALLADVLVHCGSCRDVRIETSEDHLLDARPSLLVLRRPPADRAAFEVVADWSVSTGRERPPSHDGGSGPRKPLAPTSAGPLLSLEGLPRPEGQHWTTHAGARDPAEEGHTESEPDRTDPGTATLKAMGAFGLGITFGIVIAVAASLALAGR